MNLITKKHLSRRTLLRGVGVSLALPLLDAMVPAQTPLAKTAAKPLARLGFVYVPHGAIMDQWTPSTVGSGFEFSPILKPLEPFRDRLNIVSGLAHKRRKRGPHALSPTTWLSGVRPKATEGEDVYAGTTIDQMAAQQDRPGHPVPLARSGYRRSFGADRRLRQRLQLHLLEHDVLAHADHAAAHGDQPACGVRTPVRRWRHRRRPAAPHAGRQQHPGCDYAGSEPSG